MKKTLSLILVCVLLLGTVITLVSCGKTISGTYSLGDVSYKFSGSNYTKTTKIADILGGGTKVEEGKYEIRETDDGGLEISFFTKDTEDANKLWVSFAEGKENGKKYIRMGLLTYTKE